MIKATRERRLGGSERELGEGGVCLVVWFLNRLVNN